MLQLALRWTANPFFTRVELLRFSAYFIVFFLTAQVFREREDLVKLAWFLVLLGFSVSLLGIIQFLTSADTIYWMRSLPQGGTVFGPYVNRNHFAGFVELVAPVGLALLVFRGVRRELFAITGLLTIIPVGALIFSGSRGGIVCFAFELAVLALLARTRKGLRGATMIAVAFVGVASIALIAWLGAGKAIERFSKTRIGDVSLSRRASMFRGAEHIFLDHPVKGIGLGAIVTVFPVYDTGYDGRVVDHVHNDYIEALAETGTSRWPLWHCISLDAVHRRTKIVRGRTGSFLRRASRGRDCCCLWNLAAQLCRFQSAHPFQCFAFSASGLSRNIGAFPV